MNKTSLPVVQLIDSIRSGVIDYNIVYQGENLTEEVKPMLEKYCFLDFQKNKNILSLLKKKSHQGRITFKALPIKKPENARSEKVHDIVQCF